MRNRIIWSFGSYILIKRIKWELIRIKGELSKELEKSENSFTYKQFLGEKPREEPRREILIFGEFCSSNQGKGETISQ